MSTTLSTQNTQSLQQLSSFDEETIKKIAQTTFQLLIDPDSQSTLTDNEIKAQQGLATLISIFARQGLYVDSFSSVLKDNGLSQNSNQYISDLYKQNIDLLRSKIANITVTYPRVVGCEWRLDYSVSNSETGSILSPCFFVKLLFEGGGSINFACNEEEMTALVASLKDATQEAQRNQ